jgi:hypothetical protein
MCWQHADAYTFRRKHKASLSGAQYKGVSQGGVIGGKPTCKPFTYGGADRRMAAAAGAKTIGNGVEVKASLLPGAGLGLFSGANTAFLKNEFITAYSGKTITRAQANRARNHNPRLASHMRATGDRGFIIDGDRIVHAGRGGGSFVNQGPSINARFENVGDKVFLVASQNVPPQTEFSVNYGADYQW